MKPKHAIVFVVLLLFANINAQNYFPGGVSGAEAWYIVDYNDLSQGSYPNQSAQHIIIKPCFGNPGANALFNFNHSIKATQLCFWYNAALENTTSRNVFFVGEPDYPSYNSAHLTTDWNESLAGMPQTDSIIRNQFDIANKSAYIDSLYSSYQSINNANVNFYHWNKYQVDKKFKSYGYQGETAFYIGRGFTNPQSTSQYFRGNFPEFISFPFELSSNQKNRVESYLALKYGITLDRNVSYKSARNIVFWKSSNNDLFKNRIFGIGFDKISNLNQLQSESVHYKDYLTASVGTLASTNPIKQQQVGIKDENFIVFGDNNGPDGFQSLNAFNVKPLRRVWLSQNTGVESITIPMYFKFNLNIAIYQAMQSDPSLKLWMLHDKYVTNQEESHFDSQYVDYYEAGSIQGAYAFFEKIYFDTDQGVFDQYTFGVGPEMIVQVRFDNDCDDENVKSYVVITGGRAPYRIEIKNIDTGAGDNYEINENEMAFNAVSPYTYTVTVVDANGNQNSTTVTVDIYPINVDLGPDIILTASQPQATLNAGQYVNDPEASYKWYRDGVLLEHYDPVLVTSEPGEYTVEVMSGNHICSDSDTINVYYKFTGSISPGFQCEDPHGYVTLNLSGGVGPFTTLITGPNQTIHQVHNQESYYFSEVNFGSYTITSTDINGEVYQSSFTINDPLLNIEVDLLSQLQQAGISISYESTYSYPIADPYPLSSFTLDASLLVTNPNVAYEWFSNNQSLGIYGPVITIDLNTSLPSTLQEIKVVVTNLSSGCSVSDSFGIKGYWEVEAGAAQTTAFETELKQAEAQSDNSSLKAKVYPNPSDPNQTFYYEISSNEVFDGTVQILSPTGAIIEETYISGESKYHLSFSLLASGVYFICTKTNGIVVTDKIIIR